MNPTAYHHAISSLTSCLDKIIQTRKPNQGQLDQHLNVVKASLNFNNTASIGTSYNDFDLDTATYYRIEGFANGILHQVREGRTQYAREDVDFFFNHKLNTYQ